jgi:hypothetical protein
MSVTRTDLDHHPHSSYFILTIIFIFLSILALIFFFQIIKNKTTPVQNNSEITDQTTPQLYPSIPSKLEITDVPVVPTILVRDGFKPSPTSIILTFSNKRDGFSVTYKSDRKIYTDQEFEGYRYTFYRNDGNIAVHVGSGWSWEHPGRQFTTDFQVAGKSTFRYDINSQTIVDFQSNNLNYTIQCVHGGKSSLKAECEQFLKDFKLL